MVFPDSSEDLVFGKPQLDDFGFHSTKFTIDLQTYDIECPSVVPEADTDTVRGERTLRMGTHAVVRPSGDQWEARAVVLKPMSSRKAMDLDKGNWWIEKHPDAPREVQVMEGPAVVSPEKSLKVDVLFTDFCCLNPRTPIARVREMISRRKGVEG